jgi:hypothetical protein
LQHGADPAVTTITGANAFILAAGSGRHDICNLLYENAPEQINTTDKEGKVGALMMAGVLAFMLRLDLVSSFAICLSDFSIEKRQLHAI